MPDMNRFATAFAPASVGNVAVGFDVLGHALCGLGDRVTARPRREPGVRIRAITGNDAALPTDPDENTAGRAVAALINATGYAGGIDRELDKGIPLASGLGGSAASAVAAVVAAAALVDPRLSREALYPFALAGEAAASGTPHGDNVGPQLLGGLVLATRRRLVSIPVPEGLTAVAVHPCYRVATREARACLAEPFDLDTVVGQCANLAQVLCGCYRSDFELIGDGLRDVMIEPRRARLIPGFDRIRNAAREHGALGASISGAGPTVFGWFRDAPQAETAGRAMVAAFAEAGLDARAHVSMVAAPGATITASG